jgi:hypothetical protein
MGFCTARVIGAMSRSGIDREINRRGYFPENFPAQCLTGKFPGSKSI